MRHTSTPADPTHQLTRRLRADRETLAGLLAHGDPAGAMARAVADLESLPA